MPATASPPLDCPLLLIAHLICADGQIHLKESNALQSLADDINADKHTKGALEAILSKADNAPRIDYLAAQILPGEQLEVLRQILAVACIDGYLSPQEEGFVIGLAKLWNISETEVKQLRLNAKQQMRMSSVSLVEQDDLSFGAQILKGAESVLSRALVNRLAEIAPKSIGQRVHKLQREILLSGPEYDQAISRCAQVAQEDFKVADSGLKQAHKILKNLREGIQDVLTNLHSNTGQIGRGKNAEEVCSQLEATQTELDNHLLQELAGIRRALKAKERSLNQFTIAFMGKTKAGKSTLHATITGEGWDAIGVGMQRTTRYNRVYEWKNIRIIDTPGIGAPGGEDDEAIAKSVVDESDVICYVVTDDSIQETEFEFMKVLKERTKPLIVLLNLKKNLEDPRRLENFLKKPEKVFSQGKNGINGHIERIRRYTREHYKNGYLDIVPVMLLAAQKSRREDNSQKARQLLEASRMQDFLDSLRMSIVDYGAIRRSQTLLGSTVYCIQQPKDWIEEQAQIYLQQVETLEESRSRMKQAFSEAASDAHNQLQGKIKTLFDELEQSVSRFANDHYKSQPEEIDKAWRKHVQAQNLERRLGIALEETQEKLSERIREILDEINTELTLLSSFRMGSPKKINQKKYNFWEKKEFFQYASIAAAAIGASACFLGFAALTSPIGWAVFGVGSLISFLSRGSKSKDERKRSSSGEISRKILAQVESDKTRITNGAQEQLDQWSKSVFSSIDQYFDQLSSGMRQIANCLQNASPELASISNQLNMAYAERIVRWATGEDQKVRSVRRDFGKKMEIFCFQSENESLNLLKEAEELSQILQERIDIRY